MTHQTTGLPLTEAQKEELRQALLQKLGGPGHMPVVEYKIDLTPGSGQVLNSIRSESSHLELLLEQARALQTTHSATFRTEIKSDLDALEKYKKELTALKGDIAKMLGKDGKPGELSSFKQAIEGAREDTDKIISTLQSVADASKLGVPETGTSRVLSHTTSSQTNDNGNKPTISDRIRNSLGAITWKTVTFAVILVIILGAFATALYLQKQRKQEQPTGVGKIAAPVSESENRDQTVAEDGTTGSAPPAPQTPSESEGAIDASALKQACTKPGNKNGAFCVALKDAVKFDPKKYKIEKLCDLLVDEEGRTACDKQLSEVKLPPAMDTARK